MKCETCKFFNPKGYDGMICMRYPQAVTVAPHHRCGEYAAKPTDATTDVVGVTRITMEELDALRRDAKLWQDHVAAEAKRKMEDLEELRRFARDNTYIAFR